MTSCSEIPFFRRDFPLHTPHQGAPLGNGLTGLLVWGNKNLLNLTVGRADLWDHRGGMAWSEKQSFEAISRILNSKTPEKISTLFPGSQANPATPSILPCGRVQVHLPGEYILESFQLEMANGILKVFCSKDGLLHILSLCVGIEDEDSFALSGLPPGSSFEVIPAWELSDALKDRNILPPVKHRGGFTQSLPADPAFSLDCRLVDDELQGVFSRESSPRFVSMAILSSQCCTWWQDFWRTVPRIHTGNSVLQEQYELGTYKFGAACCHKRIPPGLQGPWIEDDGLPPWGSDYHFNINVQMLFMGAFKLGKSSALLPLFRMLNSWKDVLTHNACCFAGESNGFMLPHAVDDKCRCMGDFWSGAVDHGCTIWMAQMIFEYVRYTDDLDFLRTTGFDFMKRTMAVCRKMLCLDTKNRLQLPLSVSPEYRANAPDAWGVNASFQLAGIHRLARDLTLAAELIGEEKDPFWQDIEYALPEAAIYPTEEGGEIALWEGTFLEESHRHHSHLAGIFPFDTIDTSDSRWQKILANTLNRWGKNGMGTWTGWALAWASMLHSRFNNPDMAEFCLEVLRKFFCNSSGASLHDSLNKSFSVINFGNGREIMQLDAALGAASAVQDMFFFETQGVFKCFYGIPASWKNAVFTNISAPGNIKISGRMESGITRELCFTSPKDCRIRISVPDGNTFFAGGETVKTLELSAGITYCLTPGA